MHLGDSYCNLSHLKERLALQALKNALVNQSSNAFTSISFLEDIAECEIQWQTKDGFNAFAPKSKKHEQYLSAAR